MGKRLQTMGLALAFLLGAGLFSYPMVSDWLYTRSATRAIETYAGDVAEMPDTQREALQATALCYNAALAQATNSTYAPTLAKTITADYQAALNEGKTGMMAWLEIPTLGVYLPVYHGTSEETLLRGVGHIEGTSLPTGGEGTHTGLTAHSGLPDANLFSGLQTLAVGDVFYLHVLGEALAYTVEEAIVTLPEDTAALAPEPGQDLATLVTCTPTGVNTHRLLVRGVRTPLEEAPPPAETIPATSQRAQTWQYFVLLALSTALILVLVRGKKRAEQ